MKKLFILILSLCLLLSCAQAEKMEMDAYMFMSLYNLYADTFFGVPALSKTKYTQDKNPFSDGTITYWMDDQFIVTVILNAKGEMAEASVYAQGNADGGDFIARCANVLYCFDGITVNNYEQLLSTYFQARVNPINKESGAILNTGSKIIFAKTDNLFVFGISK